MVPFDYPRKTKTALDRLLLPKLYNHLSDHSPFPITMERTLKQQIVGLRSHKAS
jgi:hypothetical protein